MASRVGRKMPRVQEVVLPLLREALPGVQVVSWIPNVEQRRYPIIGIRRLGGLPYDPEELDLPVIEVTAYGDESLPDTEDLYADTKYILWKAVQDQTVTTAGHLTSYFETLGSTQFESPYENTWRVQGLIQVGLRPLSS